MKNYGIEFTNHQWLDLQSFFFLRTINCVREGAITLLAVEFLYIVAHLNMCYFYCVRIVKEWNQHHYLVISLTTELVTFNYA